MAIGTLDYMGVDIVAHWDEVLRANMAKEVGTGKRGFAIDLVKPEGWIGPNHSMIIANTKAWKV